MPGWNSLEQVQSIHDWFQAGALLFFAALVVFDAAAHFNKKKERTYETVALIFFGIAVLMEFVAFPYSKRSDYLANQRIAELNLRASQNEREAARERGKLAWRRLEGNQQNDVAARLESFAGEPALVSYDHSDAETAFFASDITVTLHAAKWNVFDPLDNLALREGPLAFGTSPPTPTGVQIWSTEDESSRNAARALVEALRSEGFDATISREAQGLLFVHPTPMRVAVSVEHKPEGAQGEYKFKEQSTPEMQ